MEIIKIENGIFNLFSKTVHKHLGIDIVKQIYLRLEQKTHETFIEK